MNAKLTSALAIVGVILFGSLVIISLYISANNREIALKNQAVAMQRSNEAHFDKMWKVIQQTAQISNEYRNAFEDIYPDLIQGRYGNARGGSLLSFIQENNPNFDIKLYENVQVAIEAQRESFFRDQQKLLSIKEQHDNIRLKFPSNLFVGNRAELKINIITSDQTSEVFKTGQENNIDLFRDSK